VSARFKRFAYVDADNRMTKFLQRYPDAPLAQPMNVVGGHVICTVVGLAASHWIGPQPWSLALAVGCAALRFD